MVSGIHRNVEELFYKYGLFASRHPVVMLILSAFMIFTCCSPLLNLPLPGSEPATFFTSTSSHNNNIDSNSADVGFNLFNIDHEKPSWFLPCHHTAYVQQFLIKSTVRPWPGDSASEKKALMDSLASVFEVLDFLKTRTDEGELILDHCYKVDRNVIKPNKKTKTLFPENDCLMISPASFWQDDEKLYLADANKMNTIKQYGAHSIHTPPSIEELFFGISKRQDGVKMFMQKETRNHIVTYAITLVLNKFNPKTMSSIKTRLEQKFGAPVISRKDKRCFSEHLEEVLTGGDDCENASSILTHVHFKPQIGIKDLFPLISTYLFLGGYIHFSVRKIRFVKSKLGMAFSAVVSIVASLMISVGLCSLIGLTPTLNGGELLPYLVCIVGLENILVITKSVVATNTHLDVEKRIAIGLEKEGCSIIKNLLMEFVLLFLGSVSGSPAIREFCAFAFVGVISDFFMHTMFFVPVLSIDIRRLDASEHNYVSDEEPEPTNNGIIKRGSIPFMNGGTSRYSRNGFRNPLRNHKRQKSDYDYSAHVLEIGGRQITIPKIPKRLKVFFFFADTRMVQRGLMIMLGLWTVLICYNNPVGFLNTNGSMSQKYPTVIKVENTEMNPGDSHFSDIVFDDEDVHSFEKLSFRHWPTLFAFYNVSLEDKFISILPQIIVPVVKTFEFDTETDQSEPEPSNEAAASDSSVFPTGMILPPNHHLRMVQYQMTGLDYYMTLLLGAISGMLLVFICNFLYRCLCSRRYGHSKLDNKKRKHLANSGDAYTSAVGDCVPLILTGHKHRIETIDVEGVTVVSSDIYGELKVWDTDTGECSCTINRNSSRATDSMNNAADSSLNSSVAETSANTSYYDPLVSPVWCMCLSQNLVFAGCQNGSVEIWDAVSALLKGLYPPGKPGIVHIACQETKLICARINGTLDIFTIQGTTSDIQDSQIHHRGGNKTSLNIPKLADVADLQNLQLVLTCSVKCSHQQPITSFQVFSDWILTGSADHSLKLFHMDNGELLRTMYGHSGAITVAYIDKSKPGLGISGCTNGVVCLWNLHNGSKVHKLSEHKGPIISVQCSSTHVVSIAQDDQLCIWSRKTGNLLQSISLDTEYCQELCLLGQYWFVTGGKGEIALWDLRSGELTQRLKTYNGSFGPPIITCIKLLGHLHLVCAGGRELAVVRLPSVLEKAD